MTNDGPIVVILIRKLGPTQTLLAMNFIFTGAYHFVAEFAHYREDWEGGFGDALLSGLKPA